MENVFFGCPNELVNSLAISQGSSACSLESTNIVKHNQRSREDKSFWDDHFDGDVFCTKKEYVNIGINYENAVNNQRGREDVNEQFEAKSLPWGEWVKGKENLVIEYKGQYYLRYYTELNANSDYGEFIYHFEDGTELDEFQMAKMREFLTPKKKKTPVDETTQKIEKEVKPKNVKVDGIVALTVGGKKYIRKIND